MHPDYDSYNGGMLPDSATRKRKALTSIDLPRPPKFKKIKRVPRLKPSGSVVVNLILGMLFVFPAISLLTLSFPQVMLSVYGIFFLISWSATRSFKYALSVLGVCLGVVLLGFVSFVGYVLLLK